MNASPPVGTRDKPAYISCTNCNKPLPATDEATLRYLLGQANVCWMCGASVNWWSALRQLIAENFMLVEAFSAIGARTTTFKIQMVKGRSATIDPEAFGIVQGARVLSVNFTPQGAEGGALFPLKIHGNVQNQRFEGREITVYPMPLGDAPPDACEVSVAITWMPPSHDPGAAVALLTAFEAYVAGDYQAAIIPANVAVESALARVMSEFISRHVSKKRVEDFLNAAVTYSHQLNVVLPLITSLLQLPQLPDQVRGVLNRLRDHRNDVAHRGTTKHPLTKDDMADCLTAAVLAVRYIDWMGKAA